MGELDGESAALLALGAIASALGADEEAGTHLRQALEWMERAHDRPGAALALAHLARLAGRAGDHEAARRLAEQAVASSEEAGSQREEAQALTALGTVCLNAGWPEPAEAAYRQALQIHERLSGEDPPLEALAGAGANAWSKGHVEEALAKLDVILGAIADGPPGGDDPAFILAVCWEIAEAADRPEKAKQVEGAAAAFLANRTSGVTDCERRQLLEWIPTNRQLAVRLGIASRLIS